MGRTIKAGRLTGVGLLWCRTVSVYRRSLRFPTLAWQVLSVAARRFAFVHHVQGVELEVVTVIKPRAGEVKETQASASRERQRIDCVFR